MKKENKDGSRQTIGVTGSYVDDALNAGTKGFQNLTEITLHKFESKPRTYDNFDFHGAKIETIGNADFSFDQRYYTSGLSTLPLDSSFDESRRVRAFSWLVHSHLEVACLTNKAAQVTPHAFSTDKVKELNAGIAQVKSRVKRGLRYASIDLESAHLRVYVDVSYASNDDLSSQIRFIILLADAKNHRHILDYSSRKSRRVFRSIMCGETCAFLSGFDATFAISADLRLVLGRELELVMFTDSKQLFDVLTRGKRTTERRLMVEIASARASYKVFEIHNVGLVRGSDIPADGVTKTKSIGALERLVDNLVDDTCVVAWIDRTTSASSALMNRGGSVNGIHVLTDVKGTPGKDTCLLGTNILTGVEGTPGKDTCRLDGCDGADDFINKCFFPPPPHPW